MIKKYPLLMRLLHWSMALLIIVTLIIGLTMEGYPKEMFKPAINLHKSLGVTVFGLLMLRITTRLLSSLPRSNFNMSLFESILSKIVHFALYGAMFAVPLSGYFMSICYGYSVGWFGIVLPSILIKNEQLGEYFSEIHEISANILIGLIVLHIIGFIKHLVVDKKNLLKRMI